MLCTLNCASVPEEMVGAYGQSRDALAALAAAEPVGCEGLSVLPYLVRDSGSHGGPITTALVPSAQ